MSYHSKFGDKVCVDGYLWELTYSEMGPPNSRQNTGLKCPTCSGMSISSQLSNSDSEDCDNRADLE